ncbi:MAG: ribonuclease [Casimicrobiaceae bacterium]
MIRIAVIRLVAVALCAASLGAPAAFARGPATADIALATLPAEARDVLARIKAGGPFRYERDGVVFGNRERQLPEHRRGYYHEYTVPTPGASNRGARRIVCGGPKSAPDACYYTGDHYRSFARIRE